MLTEALGGVKNLQVTDPTTSSLKVRWEPAEGNVRQYRIFYVPASGGAEDMVRKHTTPCYSLQLGYYVFISQDDYTNPIYPVFITSPLQSFSPLTE